MDADVIVLDEAQRAKNFRTKTAATLHAIPSRFRFVLTGKLRLRIDAGAGLAQLRDARDLALGARAGLDGEYWFSKHVGVGAELGVAAFGTVDFGDGDHVTATWVTFAPAVTVRGRDRGSFPMLRLAGGVMRAHFDENHDCDPGDVDCTSSSSGSNNDWGPYAALTGAAAMAIGDGVEFGAFLRVEAAALVEYRDIFQGVFACTLGTRLRAPLPCACGAGGFARLGPFSN
ncbi:MAG TPA: hypothetical protein VMI54_12365 [Polyangiaceae bacterium]|nr:hypothetical protein [Polyangiaceae bacterium]